MAFTLLSELVELREDKALSKAIPLVESVETLISNALIPKLEGDDPFGTGGLKLDDVAAQIAGLIMVANPTNRSSFDDFTNVTPDGFSEKLLQFLTDLGEANSKAEFDENSKNADNFLLDLGNTFAKSLTAKWKKALEHAYVNKDETSEQTKQAIINDLNKISAFWKKTFDKLKSHHSMKKADQVATQVTGGQQQVAPAQPAQPKPAAGPALNVPVPA